MDPLARAAAFGAEGNVAQAVEILEEHVRNSPDDWRAQHDLGVCFLALGQIPQAVEKFEEALKLGAGDPVPQVTQAVMMHAAGGRDAAVGELQKLAASLPDSLYAWENYAALLWACGRQIETAKAMARAKELSDGRALNYQEAVVRAAAGEFEIRVRPDGSIVFKRGGVAALGPEATDPRQAPERAIKLACSGCQTTLYVAPALGGRRVACPNCRATTEAPEDKTPPAVHSLRPILAQAALPSSLRGVVDGLRARLESSLELQIGDVRLRFRESRPYLEKLSASTGDIEESHALKDATRIEYRSGAMTGAGRAVALAAALLLVASFFARVHSYLMMGAFLGGFALLLPVVLYLKPRRGFHLSYRTGAQIFFPSTSATATRGEMGRLHAELFALSLIAKALALAEEQRE
jgi:hypothetical protein